ncbi:MAG: TetR/AcrR family transcriptional regulator [Planctomycetota bacterium]
MDRALKVFWERGFAATSYEDLVSASGASRNGLYSEFGDKKSLFLVAIRRYRETFVAQLLSGLRADDVSAADIREVVLGVAKMAGRPTKRRGCFLANAAMDQANCTASVQKAIRDHMEGMAAEFASAYERVGLSKKRSRELGNYCTGVLHGLFVLARAQANTSMVEAFAANAVKALP